LLHITSLSTVPGKEIRLQGTLFLKPISYSKNKGIIITVYMHNYNQIFNISKDKIKNIFKYSNTYKVPAPKIEAGTFNGEKFFA